jgi:hypothetical protein
MVRQTNETKVDYWHWLGRKAFRLSVGDADGDVESFGRGLPEAGGEGDEGGRADGVKGGAE